MRVVANQTRDGITLGETYHVTSESEVLYMIINDYGREENYYKTRFDPPIIETIILNQRVKHANGKTYEVKEVAGVVSLVEFVDLPEVGELCLFGDFEHSFKKNNGTVAVLTKIDEQLFYFGEYYSCLCKPIRCIS